MSQGFQPLRKFENGNLVQFNKLVRITAEVQDLKGGYMKVKVVSRNGPSEYLMRAKYCKPAKP